MIEYTDWETGETKRLVERVDVLEQQRAELLEALRQCKDALYEVDYSAPEIAMAREVIAKVEVAE